MLSNSEQVRLKIGDTDTDEPYLEDSVISFLLTENGNDILETSIEALTAIINQLALAPDRWEIGDASETKADIDHLEHRLQELINERNAKKFKAVPVIINTDRKDWKDLDWLKEGW